MVTWGQMQAVQQSGLGRGPRDPGCLGFLVGRFWAPLSPGFLRSKGLPWAPLGRVVAVQWAWPQRPGVVRVSAGNRFCAGAPVQPWFSALRGA